MILSRVVSDSEETLRKVRIELDELKEILNKQNSEDEGNTEIALAAVKISNEILKLHDAIDILKGDLHQMLSNLNKNLAPETPNTSINIK